ncbi:DUF7332 family protein [Halobellus rarus]|uniref:Uncharacterized protein n=1 Tax=Halobellus rarus TaxID=1126237 RepID=A0ABD6CRF1_9EURY|nr:hypothetical protein [Halobellus rarus]
MGRRSGTPVFVRLLVVALVCSVVVAVAAVPPAAAQSGDTDGSGSAAETDERRCFPADGHDLTVGDGNPHINVTVHTSLFTDPSPPSALGLEARGVALDSDVIGLRTGVLFEGVPEEASTEAVWNSFVILFDYRFSLPMFSDSVDDSTYEPTGGPVSGVETRGC